MLIFVSTPIRKSFLIEIESDILVSELKSKIFQKEAIPTHLQRLVFSGKDLDDNSSLADYNIQDSSVLHLVLRLGNTLRIYVKGLHGKTLAFHVEKTANIKSIKEKVEDVQGVPTCQQRLILDGQELFDTKCLRYCDVTMESTFSLVTQPCNMDHNHSTAG